MLIIQEIYVNLSDNRKLHLYFNRECMEEFVDGIQDNGDFIVADPYDFVLNHMDEYNQLSDELYEINMVLDLSETSNSRVLCILDNDFDKYDNIITLIVTDDDNNYQDKEMKLSELTGLVRMTHNYYQRRGELVYKLNPGTLYETLIAFDDDGVSIERISL